MKKKKNQNLADVAIMAVLSDDEMEEIEEFEERTGWRTRTRR